MIILISSCTKFGKNVTIKGRVVNPITGEGIPNAPVVMYRSTLDYPSGSKRVKETTTDSDGYFEISKASLSKCYLTCHVTEIGDYYPIGWEKKDNVPLFDAFTISVKKGKTMHADYYAVPYAFLQLDIHNISCQGSTDHFVLYAEGTQVDMGKSGLMIDEMGCYQFTASDHSKVPMGARYYRWEVTKNAVTTIFYDTIYLAEGEYKTYTINY
ncbi:carboxypeptidase-like regulatory domain-containing protein [Fluviicola chungangensis]|nr:carboxypeptidase-like regulatory domain-containing protein [Fluviicola chungangensis]